MCINVDLLRNITNKLCGIVYYGYPGTTAAAAYFFIPIIVFTILLLFGTV